MTLCQQLALVSAPVYIIVMLFSMSSWVDIVGLWVEMPLLVNSLPEGWNLPSYMTIIIQCANIGPVVYSIIQKLKPKREEPASRISPDVILSFVIIVVGMFSMFFMSFFWNITAEVGGSLHSVVLLALLSCNALVSCMSSVVFLPYMARFPTAYISAYYFGQGLSGFVPGMVGLVQGVGSEPKCVNISQEASDNTTEWINKPIYNPPRFSIKVFLLFISGLLLISLVAFYVLNFAKFCRKAMKQADIQSCSKIDHKIESSNNIENKRSDDSNETEYLNRNGSESISSGVQPDDENKICTEEETENKPASSADEIVLLKKDVMPVWRFVFFLSIIALVSSMTNGILPATQSYTCLPFGNKVYTLAIRLSSVVSPLASLSCMFLPRASAKVVGFLALLGTSVATFHLVLASQSPHPILQYELSGAIIVVISSVVMTASFSFIRVSVASILLEEGGRRELLWCGGITQIGGRWFADSVVIALQREQRCSVVGGKLKQGKDVHSQ